MRPFGKLLERYSLPLDPPGPTADTDKIAAVDCFKNFLLLFFVN